MKKKVCLYCRVATKGQLNLETQTENIKNFANQKGLEVIKIISEFGSGLNFERKGLAQLLEVAKSKHVDMILTKDVARIGRDNIQTLKFIDNIQKYVEFKTVESFDIPNNEWDNMLSVLSKFFETYKKEIAC